MFHSVIPDMFSSGIPNVSSSVIPDIFYRESIIEVSKTTRLLGIPVIDDIDKNSCQLPLGFQGLFSISDVVDCPPLYRNIEYSLLRKE